MTTLNLPGVIRPAQAEQVRRYVRALLESRLPSRPNLGESIAVALGGNAETLMTVAPGPRQHGVPTLQLSLLRERLDDILRRDVRERMKAYACAATVPTSWPSRRFTFVTLGRYLNLRTLSIPGVGIREGLLQKSRARLFRARSRIATAPRRVSSWLARAASHAAWNTISVTPNTCASLASCFFDELQPVHHFAGGIARAARSGRAAPRCRSHDQSSRPP